jgi:hypothetical protein
VIVLGHSSCVNLGLRNLSVYDAEVYRLSVILFHGTETSVTDDQIVSVTVLLRNWELERVCSNRLLELFPLLTVFLLNGVEFLVVGRWVDFIQRYILYGFCFVEHLSLPLGHPPDGAQSSGLAE